MQPPWLPYISFCAVRGCDATRGAAATGSSHRRTGYIGPGVAVGMCVRAMPASSPLALYISIQSPSPLPFWLTKRRAAR